MFCIVIIFSNAHLLNVGAYIMLVLMSAQFYAGPHKQSIYINVESAQYIRVD